jgi:hypothetical protein
MPVISAVFATVSGSRFLIEEAERRKAVAHLLAHRGKAVMGLDEGLPSSRAGLGGGRIVDDRCHVRRRDSDIGLGPDLALVIGIFACADGHELVRDEVSRC